MSVSVWVQFKCPYINKHVLVSAYCCTCLCLRVHTCPLLSDAESRGYGWVYPACSVSGWRWVALLGLSPNSPAWAGATPRDSPWEQAAGSPPLSLWSPTGQTEVEDECCYQAESKGKGYRIKTKETIALWGCTWAAWCFGLNANAGVPLMTMLKCWCLAMQCFIWSVCTRNWTLHGFPLAGAPLFDMAVLPNPIVMVHNTHHIVTASCFLQLSYE